MIQINKHNIKYEEDWKQLSNYTVDDGICSLDMAICKLLILGDLIGEANNLHLTKDHTIGLATLIKEIHQETTKARNGISMHYKTIKNLNKTNLMKEVK